MISYKNLGYGLKTKFYVLSQSGDPTGESWNENLGTYKLPDGSDGSQFYNYANTIIESFSNLFVEGSYRAGDKTLSGAVQLDSIMTEIDEDPTAGVDIGSDTVNFSLQVKNITNLAETTTARVPGYWTGNIDSDTAPLLDTFARALTNLSVNTYRETNLVTVITIDSNGEG